MKKLLHGDAKYYTMQFASLFVASFFAPIFKLGIQMDINLTPENSFFYRMIILSIVLGVYCLINPKQRAELKYVCTNKRVFGMLALLGIFRGVETILWAFALVDSATFIVNILDSVIPIYVIIGSYLIYKEKTSWRAMVGIVIAIAGVIIIGGASDGVEGGATLKTIVLMSFSSMLGAVYLFMSRSIRNNVGAITTMLFVFLWGIPLYGGFCVVRGSVMGPIPPVGWLLTIFSALVGTFIGQVVTMYVVKFMKPSHVSMTNLTAPVFSAVTAFLVLGESLTAWILLGGLTVIVGLASYILIDDKDKRNLPQPEAEPPKETTMPAE